MIIKRDKVEDYSHWNFRVIKDGEEYKVCEVHYKKNSEVFGWADTSDHNLIWESLEDLIGTYELIGHAFKKPVLEVVGDKLIEV